MSMNSNNCARYIFLAVPALVAVTVVAGEEFKIGKRGDTAAVPFTIEHDRIFVKVELNGKVSCRAILDTGSEVTLVNSALVKVDLKTEGQDSFHGDFIGAFEAKRAVLDSLMIGTQVTKAFPIGVIDHGAGKKLHQVEMVLGMDFLRRQRFSLDFEKSELTFWPHKFELPRPPENIERHRLRTFRGTSLDDPRVRLVAEINQKAKGTFLIDTAADTPAFVIDKAFEEYGIVHDGTPAGMMVLNDNGSREEVKFYSVDLRFDFDKAAFPQVKSRAFDVRTIKSPLTRRSMHNYYNIIGLAFLKTLAAVHFDPAASVIQFDRRK
jgi:hypothetical protein